MHCRGKCLQLAALLLAVACGPAAGAAVHRARGVDFITAQLIGSSVSSHVRQTTDDRPNAHFSRDAWQPVQEDRYLTSPTNRDWTDAADRSDTIHIRRRWEKKRRKGKRVARSTLWQPVELITHAKNNSFSSRILKVDSNEASPNASDSLNGTDSGEWVQVSLTGPAPTKAAGLPRPRSTFQSPFESIISLSPEVPHLVKGFITNSHGDLMQPETLIVKYQSGGEPHIDGIYTTSPTVDGTLFGVVNSQYRPYNPPSTSQGSHYPQFPSQGSHYPHFPSQGSHYHETPSQGPHYPETPSQDPQYPETPSQIPQYPHDFVNRPQPEYTHPQHNYDPFDFQQHQKPSVPSPPTPTIYSNFDDFDDFGETLHNKPNFGTVQQVAKPTHPPTIHPLVVDAPDNHSPQMHGGNYEYHPPAQDNYAEPDVVQEVLEELIEGADEEETTRPPVVYYPTHTTPPIVHYPVPTTPTTTTLHQQQLVESTYKPPTIIYGGIPSPPVSQTTSLEQNCPNVTIIVSPTITNHNVQNYGTPAPINYPSSSSYRPPNYPPPNHGGHYGYRPPSPTKPTDVIVLPPSHDTPVEEDDDVLANQEATEAPATEPPATSSEVPPVTEPPVVITTTTVRPSILNELGQIFFNTTSPVFWLILVSPVLAMLSMLVGMTRYVIPGWRSSSDPHDHGKEVAHSIVVTKQSRDLVPQPRAVTETEAVVVSSELKPKPNDESKRGPEVEDSIAAVTSQLLNNPQTVLDVRTPPAKKQEVEPSPDKKWQQMQMVQTNTNITIKGTAQTPLVVSNETPTRFPPRVTSTPAAVNATKKPTAATVVLEKQTTIPTPVKKPTTAPPKTTKKEVVTTTPASVKPTAATVVKKVEQPANKRPAVSPPFTILNRIEAATSTTSAPTTEKFKPTAQTTVKFKPTAQTTEKFKPIVQTTVKPAIRRGTVTTVAPVTVVTESIPTVATTTTKPMVKSTKKPVPKPYRAPSASVVTRPPQAISTFIPETFEILSTEKATTKVATTTTTPAPTTTTTTTTAAPVTEKSKKKKKNKKNKKRRRRPSSKPENKIDSELEEKEEKPLTSRIIDYLSGEGIPSFGTTVVGLLMTAGLAGLLFFPMEGFARRSDHFKREDENEGLMPSILKAVYTSMHPHPENDLHTEEQGPRRFRRNVHRRTKRQYRFERVPYRPVPEHLRSPMYKQASADSTNIMQIEAGGNQPFSLVRLVKQMLAVKLDVLSNVLRMASEQLRNYAQNAEVQRPPKPSTTTTTTEPATETATDVEAETTEVPSEEMVLVKAPTTTTTTTTTTTEPLNDEENLIRRRTAD